MPQLLCIGDVHLGRWPSRLPPALSTAGSPCSPAGALEQAVSTALQRRPDAVLFAGDLVERHDDRFAAWNHLARAVERLLSAGIAVVGVAGNHDVEALPRLAERLPAFRLLGRAGRFEALDLHTRDGAGLRIWGWSFPSAHHTQDPLSGLAAARAAAGPCRSLEVGLLHCDLDQAHSRYAPVPRRALEATGLAAWFLGHVHQPSLCSLGPGRPWIGYLGSLIGLDPGEHGPRGPWWVEARAGQALRVEHLPQGALRYERRRLDVSRFGQLSADDLADRLHAALDRCLAEALERIVAEQPELKALALRLELVGALRARRHLGTLLSVWQERSEWPQREQRGALAFIESVEDNTRLDLDLTSLARDAGPLGHLAQRLLELEKHGEPEGASAADPGARLAAQVEPLLARYAYLEPEAALPPSQRRAAQARACRRALEALLEQLQGTQP
jgi:DNA repair exonuclease SbcCD nuclease subunit